MHACERARARCARAMQVADTRARARACIHARARIHATREILHQLVLELAACHLRAGKANENELLTATRRQTCVTSRAARERVAGRIINPLTQRFRAADSTLSN